jgi:hypothetical protein
LPHEYLAECIELPIDDGRPHPAALYPECLNKLPPGLPANERSAIQQGP